MEITNIPSSPRWTSRQEESLGSSYSLYVKSCFHYRSDLAPYYEQLLRFLELGIQHGTSHLQIPRFFELRNQPQTLPEGGLTAFKELPNGIPRQSPRIAVLEGFPSPECIGSIGAGQLARPELFIGHLDFSRDPNSLHRYFELPALPSDRSNIVHVRLITLGQSLSGVKKTDLHVRDRAAVDRECLDFENQLFRRKHYGATRFRKVHLHNTRVFSVEQIVSFSVTQQKGQPWCGKSSLWYMIQLR